MGRLELLHDEVAARQCKSHEQDRIDPRNDASRMRLSRSSRSVRASLGCKGTTEFNGRADN
jgi:hypothetical protein